jgi:hypothetical protein
MFEAAIGLNTKVAEMNRLSRDAARRASESMLLRRPSDADGLPMQAGPLPPAQQTAPTGGLEADPRALVARALEILDEEAAAWRARQGANLPLRSDR